MQVKKAVILTGMSGSGKTIALKILEDYGFYAIDNLPPALLPQLLEVLHAHSCAVNHGVAAVVDVRGEHLLNDMEAVIASIKKSMIPLAVVFLDADDGELVKRFEITRRGHPLSAGGTTLDGITKERNMISKIKEISDFIINTSGLKHETLRARIEEELELLPASFAVRVTSFGYKYGIPQDADMALDMRFLPNPFYELELRGLSGMDTPVQDYLYPLEQAQEFLKIMGDFFNFIIPLYKKTGKMRFHVGIGCTGGRHRSVAMALAIHKMISGFGYDVTLNHRDVNKESIA